jgi:hypothetical protein
MNLNVMGHEVVGWIRLAQDKDQYPDLVNTVINLGFP